MNNLSKEKKQQLLAVVVVTLAIVIGLWFGLISMQKKSRLVFEKRTDEMKKKIIDADNKLKRQEEISELLETNRHELSQREASMPTVPGAYPWLISVVNEYIKPPSSLSNFNTSPPGGAREVDLLPKFPYKCVSLPVTMMGLYNDFGKFLADFENDWPYLRVQNMVLAPVGQTVSGDERLNVQFEVVSLTLTNKVEIPGIK
jgi:Tfp pilus assembly protein PilO